VTTCSGLSLSKKRQIPRIFPDGWGFPCNAWDDHILLPLELLLTSKEAKRQTGVLCVTRGGFASTSFIRNPKESSHQEQIICPAFFVVVIPSAMTVNFFK